MLLKMLLKKHLVLQKCRMRRLIDDSCRHALRKRSGESFEGPDGTFDGNIIEHKRCSNCSRQKNVLLTNFALQDSVKSAARVRTERHSLLFGEAPSRQHSDRVSY